MSEAHLDEILKPLIKTAWHLKLSKSKSAQAASCVSKFGGLPYAEKNEIWPCCPSCQNELVFIAQIKHPGENSLHTFFYCFECFPWGSTEDEETGQWLVRSYQNVSMANYVEIKPVNPPDYEIQPCRCSEQRVKVLPDRDDLEFLSPQAQALFGKDNPYEIYEAAASRSGCLTDFATLIGGYPKWIQGETTKSCEICGSKMEFFAQVDSEENSYLMWGDCGMVYLFRCPEHKTEFKLELQCY